MKARLSRYSCVAIMTLAVVACGTTAENDTVSTPEVASAQQGLSVDLANVPNKAAGVYIIRLDDVPTAAYEGTIAGLPATKPPQGQKYNPTSQAAAKYIARLSKKQDAVLKAVNVSPTAKLYSYVHTFNGVAAVLTPAQADQISKLNGVISVQVDTHHQPTTDTSPSFMGINAPGGVWDMLGGPETSGEDIIVGVIDTGAWAEHPSFSDQNDLADRPGESGKATRVYGPPPAHWRGTCQSGELWSQDDCNNKLIGARYFLNGFGRHGVIKNDYKSARDADGHGTHTGSTAAGNRDVPASIMGKELGTISGMAPRARVAVYKTCWNDAGCYGTDLVAAIDQAVADGVDVINYSIGSTTPYLVTADTVAFLFAADAGVFVAASAGNAGPGAATIGTPAAAPWVTSVGASTHGRDFQATATLGNDASYTGASITDGTAVLPLVDSAAAGSELCFPGELDAAAVAGKIVLCKRGIIARVDKSLAVSMAGGAGMILYNTTDAEELVADVHSLPSVHVSNSAGIAIQSYIGSDSAPVASLSGGVAATVSAPVMAAFSSRGPNGALGDLIKPDVTAPGVNILAGVTPSPLMGVSGQLFQTMSGTSMSSPHVAGIGALLKQLHPSWSPAMIKSALMTTGAQNTKKHDGVTPADPFDVGGGHIVPNSAADPGLVYEADFLDYLAFLCGNSAAVGAGTCNALQSMGYSFDAGDLNLASIGIAQLAGSKTITRRVTNVGTTQATYTASTDGLAGIGATVTPAALTLAPGATAEYAVTFTAQPGAALNAWTFGALTWSDGVHAVRSPVAIRPVYFGAPLEISGSGLNGSASYTVGFGFTGAFTATGHGLVAADKNQGHVVDDPANDINAALPTGVGITIHPVTVPAGTAHARFSLFDEYTDGADDIDLYVFGPTGAYLGGSGSGTSAEEVNLSGPEAGTYFVVVHGWQTDGPDANYTLFSWLVPSSVGALAVSAPSVATLGLQASIDVSWSDLTPSTKYLGLVRYEGPAGPIGSTVVRVDN